MNRRHVSNLREEAQKCVRVADRTADDKVAAALLAYACQLEQRARLIESAKRQSERISGDRVRNRPV